MKARYWAQKENKSTLCRLCPNSCLITPGNTGSCKVRRNDDGELTLPFYGDISSMGVDPIEKKPLYHFMPGSQIFSIGFVGCSLKCPFCQNHSISQSAKVRTNHLEPEEVVSLAKEQSSMGVAYTYSEPTIHSEFLIETAIRSREAGLKNVLVSNGYLNSFPAEEVLELMDAANIDLKSFNPDFYRQELKGKLQPVLDFITMAAEKTALEVTTLVIPGKNDSPEEIEEIARFLASLGKPVAYHLSRYYPTFKYSIPSTPIESVEQLAETAREHLPYVYLGNVGYNETNTYCPNCGVLLIRRSGYSVHIEHLKNTACSQCGTEIPISS